MNQDLEYLNLFSGAGDFRAAFEQIPGTKCVGHYEIDPHADKSYRALFKTEGEWFCNDARQIDTGQLPDFDLVCGGFPCQSFSTAEHRKGFIDTHGTLFFKIARILGAKKPPFVLLENVPGMLSHDQGRTFNVILGTLSELRYHVEWQVLNSKDHGVPLSRNLVFIIGYFGEGCAGKILPVLGTNGASLIQILGGPQRSRVYDLEGIACTQTSEVSGMGGKTRLYAVGFNRKDGITHELEEAYALNASNFRDLNRNQNAVLEKEATHKGYNGANVGDSVGLAYPTSNTRRGRVDRDIDQILDTGNTQGIVTLSGRIRRLTPRECFRLQGSREDQIDRILAITSDSQAYKQVGNGVTVNVLYAIGLRVKAVWAELYAESAGGSTC